MFIQHERGATGKLGGAAEATIAQNGCILWLSGKPVAIFNS